MIENLEVLNDTINEISETVINLDRVSSMVVIACEACDYSGNDIKADVGNALALMEECLENIRESIVSNLNECSRLTKRIETTMKVKGDN